MLIRTPLKYRPRKRPSWAVRTWGCPTDSGGGLQQDLDRAPKAGAPMVAAGDVVEFLPYRSGDAEGTPDPPFWTDPAAMLDVVNAMETAARNIEGIDAGRLAASAAAYPDQL